MGKVDLVPKTRNRYHNAGYITARVEHYHAAMRRRVDLFGFGDVLAVNHTLHDTVIIQVTSVANMQARIDKIAQIPDALILLSANWRIVVDGWEKVDNRWRLTELNINEETLRLRRTPQLSPPTTENPVRTGAGEV